MKNILPILVLFISVNLFAQRPPAGKAPTRKELADLMKQAEQGLANMDPKDKKKMDSLGFRIPTAGKLPASINDKQLKDAYENESLIVPRKDVTRIAGLPPASLTGSTMAAYIGNVHMKVTGRLKPAAIAASREIYQELKQRYQTGMAAGNVAVDCWMQGRVAIAVLIMGQACIDDPSNTDNLSNYASMLSMCGAEQLALPILQYVNRLYPGNSTVLNNLGQAWFGLGDMEKANRFLDTVIRMYALHPQANFTKSLILKSRGQKAEAIEAIRRSMEGGYSPEKASQLRRLGERAGETFVMLPTKAKPDGAGFRKFNRPAFPVSSEESIVFDQEWKNFKAAVDARNMKYKSMMESDKAGALEASKKRADQIIGQARVMINNGRAGSITPYPWLAEVALRKYDRLQQDYTAIELKKRTAISEYRRDIQPVRDSYDNLMKKLAAQDLEQSGEGLANRSFCPQYKAATDAFLAKYNPPLEEKWNSYLQSFREYLNESMHLNQYIMWQEDYNLSVLGLQQAWLTKLATDPGFASIQICPAPQPALSSRFGNLPEYDEVHCEYHNKVEVVFTTIETDCSRLTTGINTKFFKFRIQEDLNKKDLDDQFISCTVELGAEAGHSWEKGPLRAGATASGAVEAEIDRTGLKDLTLKAGGELSGGTFMRTESIGVAGKISLISGRSEIAGTGLLSGIGKK